jgi:hypothetical protein
LNEKESVERLLRDGRVDPSARIPGDDEVAPPPAPASGGGGGVDVEVAARAAPAR